MQLSKYKHNTGRPLLAPAHVASASPSLEMISHPDTVIGLSDGGAHCGAVCDGGMPTFMLSYWTRDRAQEAGDRALLERLAAAASDGMPMNTQSKARTKRCLIILLPLENGARQPGRFNIKKGPRVSPWALFYSNVSGMGPGHCEPPKFTATLKK